MTILSMIVPFILVGLLLTTIALAWARYKQGENEFEPESDVPESGGES